MGLNLRSKEDFEALILGASIYATGGGGDPEHGMYMLKEMFIDRGRELSILDIDELDLDSYIASPYDVGTIAPDAKLKKKAKIANPVAKALNTFRERLGIDLQAFIPVELGGSNTAVALYAAGLANIPAVDGDRVGRAAPEIHQDTAILFNKSAVPAVAVTPTGNEVIVLSYADVDDYEAILRHLSVLAGTHVVVIDTPIKVSEARDIIVRNSLSRCYSLGKKVLEARARGLDPVKIVAEEMNGWIVFKGIVKEWNWKNIGGFLVGDLIIEGIEEFRSSILRSWVKNEHIMVWLNEEPLVMPPDLFTLITKDGEPVLNSKISIGMKVYGIAAPAPSIWRSEKGLELFGPKHFGFDYSYTPVEKLVEKHGIA
ncbi:MAG TPA: DUF917 domain-containing protein [Ignisphaera sp.]|nr:DUF917 domain-containing protein [Ignisphaera sp.]